MASRVFPSRSDPNEDGIDLVPFMGTFVLFLGTLVNEARHPPATRSMLPARRGYSVFHLVLGSGSGLEGGTLLPVVFLFLEPLSRVSSFDSGGPAMADGSCRCPQVQFPPWFPRSNRL